MNVRDKLRSLDAGGNGSGTDPGQNAVLPPPSAPMEVARELVAALHTLDGVPTLRHWRGGWWEWHRPALGRGRAACA